MLDIMGGRGLEPRTSSVDDEPTEDESSVVPLGLWRRTSLCPVISSKSAGRQTCQREPARRGNSEPSYSIIFSHGNALIFGANFFPCTAEHHAPDPSEICALQFKEKFRRFGIGSVSGTIGIDRSTLCKFIVYVAHAAPGKIPSATAMTKLEPSTQKKNAIAERRQIEFHWSSRRTRLFGW